MNLIIFIALYAVWLISGVVLASKIFREEHPYKAYKVKDLVLCILTSIVSGPLTWVFFKIKDKEILPPKKKL